MSTQPEPDPNASDVLRGPSPGGSPPPRRTRFRKGQSGNSGGRPHPDDDLASLVCEALDATTFTIENGRRRRTTKRAQIAAQLVDSSAKADLRAIKLIVDLVQKLAPRLPPGEPLLDASDEKVVATLLARLGMAE